MSIDPPTGTVLRAPSAYVRRGGRRKEWLLRSAAAAAATAVLGGAIAYGIERWQRDRAAETDQKPRRSQKPDTEAAVRHLHQGAAILALSVLADSTLEHYRGDFENRAMFIAPTVAGLTLAASLRAGARPSEPGAARGTMFAAAALTGIVGTGFHIRNIRKREGGFNWTNLFYAAPLGAPLALSAAGLVGLAADQVTNGRTARVVVTKEHRAPKLFGYSPGRVLAAATSFGLLGTVAEVWLLHFRGAFQNPFMYVPVVVPPMAAAALGATALKPAPARMRMTRVLLSSTAAAGLAGVGFHAYGISRNMGGWRNWTQMILQGPPLPAPPSFAGMAVAGFGALRLIEEER